MLKHIQIRLVFIATLCFISCSLFAQERNEKSALTDTFKIANHFIARKKFRKAHKILNSYHHNHPKDLNSVWLDAQTEFWLNNNKQSVKLYDEALILHPKNDYLKLNYIHSLIEMGRPVKADDMLADLEDGGKDYSDMARLSAKLYYYQGKYGLASAYLNKSFERDDNNGEANMLYDEIELAKAPRVSLTTGYLSDNQPINLLLSSLKAEKCFNRLLTLYIVGNDYHFIKPSIADAPWIMAGDKLFFPKAGIHINVGGGAYKFPVKNETGWSGNLDIDKKISPQFDVDVSADHVPYMDAKASVDSNISAYRFSATLNWHKRSWLGQAAVMNNVFPDNNNVYSAYLWILAPVARFSFGQLMLGFSSSYSNADKNTYAPVNSISDILANYGTTPSVLGIYSPYFTPDSMFINSALLSLKMNISKKVSVNINGDVGYGMAQNPYFYLDRNLAGTITTVKGYYTEYFVPYNAAASFNYQVDKTWFLSVKYNYHNSFFFTSNYVSLGIEKSFLSYRQRDPAPKTTSTFSRTIHEIERKIQLLKSCSNADELRKAVQGVKEQLATLCDAQRMKKDMSEILPDSDEANLLKERCDNLNEMITELDAVSLSDYQEPNTGIKQWLAEKLYELTSITYNGNSEDQ